MRRSNSLFYLILFILTVGIAGQATAGRYYDPAYGRWTTFDPALNEKSPKELLQLQNGKLFAQSPYNYSYNNPLRFIDPDGKVPILPILWAAAEAGFAAYDLYQLYQVYNDPNATDQERAEQYYATMSGLLAPGGGYKQIKEGVTSFFKGLFKSGDGAKALVQQNRIAGQSAEAFLRETYGGTRGSFKTSDGWRFIDNLTEAGVAMESKVGRTSLSKIIHRQLLKDAELLKTGQVESVEWHFTRSKVTGKIGPTENLRKALEEHGIKIVIQE